uniref:Tetraspanin-33 n=1 Tax=Crocodylus porosus TaxID=8502 RepID=A0A7M4FI46_CROPO
PRDRGCCWSWSFFHVSYIYHWSFVGEGRTRLASGFFSSLWFHFLPGAVDSLLVDPSLILLTVGILMFAITFAGCTGALRDLPMLLKIFECCGVHSYKDWSRNIYFECRDSNPSLERCAVPFSCCTQEDKGTSVLNTMCGYGTQNLRLWKAESLIYTEGCLEKIVSWGQRNLLLVAGLAIGLFVLEVTETEQK